MKNKCLYCYEPIEKGSDFHRKCAVKFFGQYPAPQIEYKLDEMDALAKNIVERSISVPGVQPKLSMSLIKDSRKRTNSRLKVVGALGGQFIFKPPVTAYPEMPENEHLTMRIAGVFGIEVVDSSLIRLASGELSYITKRIDRTENGEKIHMLDMFQITESFDKYKSSLEKVGKAIDMYSDFSLLDKTKLFELSVFAFLSGNNDMHLKNFSMVQTASGWRLSPAYDLLNVAIVLPEDSEESALTMTGKKRGLKRIDFEKFAENLGLSRKQIDNVFERFFNKKSVAIQWIDKSFLSPEMKTAYRQLMESRYKRLLA